MKSKILIIFCSIIICFAIYKISYKDKKLLVAIGDNSCLATSINGANGYSYNKLLLESKLFDELNEDLCLKNASVADILDIIKDNKRLSKNSIQAVLDKADLITVNVGFTELTSYKQVNNITKRDFLNNFRNLINIIRKYSNAKIIIIGFYPNYFNNYVEINNNLQVISQNTKAIFIDTSIISQKKDNFYNKNYYNLNYNGNKEIFRLINKYL